MDANSEHEIVLTVNQSRDIIVTGASHSDKRPQYVRDAGISPDTALAEIQVAIPIQKAPRYIANIKAQWAENNDALVRYWAPGKQEPHVGIILGFTTENINKRLINLTIFTPPWES